MSLSRPQLDVLVALVSESLRVSAMQPLTDLVIADRARNLAALLDLTYEMRPRPEPAEAPALVATIGDGCDSEDGRHCSHWPDESCCICDEAAGPAKGADA